MRRPVKAERARFDPEAASHLPARRGVNGASKTPDEGSTPSAGANLCREPASAGVGLQNRRSECDPLAALQVQGDVREQANPAGCEPATERIDTATSPQIFVGTPGQHDGRAAAL
jgi:hypothetical protein